MSSYSRIDRRADLASRPSCDVHPTISMTHGPYERPRLQPLWKRSFDNECGSLVQGIRDIPVTEACLFIKLTNISKDRQITYGKIVCNYKPHKKEK
jgi:hypothetical protein